MHLTLESKARRATREEGEGEGSTAQNLEKKNLSSFTKTIALFFLKFAENDFI